jgi:hypothetical protein
MYLSLGIKVLIIVAVLSEVIRPSNKLFHEGELINKVNLSTSSTQPL